MFYQFQKEGKGIDPNAPKKTGFAWFLDIIFREFWAMLWLNFLFLVYSLPLFTIGASYAAMNTLLLRMVRDQPVDAFRDFREEFGKNFKQSTLVFLLQVLVAVVLGVNLLFYREENQILEIFIWSLIFLFALVNMYVTPVMVSIELKIPHIFKNSFLLLFLNGKYTLLASLLWLVIGFIHLWFYPVSIFPVILFSIVFMNFINCFLTFYGIKKYCYPQEETV
ncbi:MAG: DUF624 domain-containing protein [Eubacteriales bacterium]